MRGIQEFGQNSRQAKETTSIVLAGVSITILVLTKQPINLGLLLLAFIVVSIQKGRRKDNG